MSEKKKQEGKKRAKNSLFMLIGALASLICAIIMAILIYHEALIMYFSDTRQVMAHSCAVFIGIGVIMMLYAWLVMSDLMDTRIGMTRKESERIMTKMERIMWMGGIFIIGAIIGLVILYLDELIASYVQDTEQWTFILVYLALAFTAVFTFLALLNYSISKKSKGDR